MLRVGSLAVSLLLVYALAGCTGSFTGLNDVTDTITAFNERTTVAENTSVNSTDTLDAANASVDATNVTANDTDATGVDSLVNVSGNGTIVSPRARLNRSLLGLVPSTDPTPRIVSFTLFSADANTPIIGYENLTGTIRADRGQLPERLSLRANYAGDVTSVLFELNGDENHRVENAAPFALNGDDAGNYVAWRPSKGSYEITATPYRNTGATGPAGEAATITIVFYAEDYLDRTT